MKVTVAETSPGVGWRVVHEGRGYGPSYEVDVPEDVARRWARNGWIEPPEFEPEPSKPIDSPELVRKPRPKRKPRASEPVVFIETEKD
jgi:hypothetical protein